MLQEWLAKGVFLYLMAGVCGLGVVLRVLLSTYYNRQLHWTQKMAAVRKKWLIRMREDYESCMDENGRVNNVDIFVDKYIEGKKCMGILLSTWDKIGGQAWILCAGLLAVSAVSSVFYQVEREAVLFTFFIGTWTVIVNIVVDNIANLKEKKNQIKRNLVDYFENRMSTLDEDMFPEEDAETYRPEFAQESEAFHRAEQTSAESEAASFRKVEQDSMAGESTEQENAAFRRAEQGSAAQFSAAQEEHDFETDEYSGAIHIRHLSKAEGISQQSAALEEEYKANVGRKPTGKMESPKFYVINGAERKSAQEESEEEELQTATDVISQDAPGKKVRRESKKEMMARKKREHIKCELKREITQDAKRNMAEQEEEETVPAAPAEKSALQEGASQNAKKTPSREAVEQLAAALELLKRENILEETAPLLAAQIGKDQENGALIEEVLREFLI